MRKQTFHKVEVWMQPERTCYVQIRTAAGSVWVVPLKVVIGLAHRYYEETGWDDEDELAEGERQPVGTELRGIMLANCNAVEWAREIEWHRLRGSAKRLCGNDEPPDDLLWAVEESGGDLALVTTLDAQRQRQSKRVLWSVADPAAW